MSIFERHASTKFIAVLTALAVAISRVEKPHCVGAHFITRIERNLVLDAALANTPTELDDLFIIT